jgi:hypothetical protein
VKKPVGLGVGWSRFFEMMVNADAVEPGAFVAGQETSVQAEFLLSEMTGLVLAR